jgi:hypothetical protein
MVFHDRWHRIKWLGAALAFLLFAGGAWGFRQRQHLFLDLDEEPDSAELEPPPSEFEYVFTRLAYSSPNYNFNRNMHSWNVDYPKADRQFLQGLLRYTGIQSRRQEQVLRPLDPELSAYPFLYAVEVGYMQLSDEEAARLREYLLRGGFLVVDDFHGTAEWANFELQMKKVFPDRAIRDVPLSDPVFHCFFDIEELFQVPGLQYYVSGRTYEKDGYDARFAGIYDDNGRIMVMINFNSDLGDAWEWADLPQYEERYTSQAYRLGVNYIVYSLTH